MDGSRLALGADLERPPIAHGLVPRVPLFHRLSAAQPGGVVLVQGPAGSGKTILVRSWIEAEGLADRVAWVSVERGERDAQRFWLSLVDQLASTTDRDELVERVSPSPAFGGEAVVERLLSDLRSLERPIVLVVDDLHELQSPDALQLLERFVGAIPPELRVVLSTRDEPRLGLHRLRVAGSLVDVGGADLLFSLAEASELLRASGVTLSDTAKVLLHERTEGWAAGLRLAAISLAQNPDPDHFVAEFSGSERTVAAYLLAEVLEREPAEVRDLLLRTCVLEWVTGPLADALTGGKGSEAILQHLEEANAFVTSVDVGRSCFRYHHLLTDLLRLELRRTAPATIDSLHRAAAQWFEEHGYTIEAIRHAQEARDWALASRLIADHHLEMTLDGRSATVRELLRAFPRTVAESDPEVALVFATAKLLEGERDDSGAYLDLARRLAGTVLPERAAGFDVILAAMTLVVARWRGDVEAVLDAMPAVDAALRAQPAGEGTLRLAIRSIALLNLGVAKLWAMRPDEARRDLEESLALARRAGYPWLMISTLGHLSVAGVFTGMSYAEALRFSEQALEIAESHGWPDDPIVLIALASGAICLLWLGRLGESERWLQRAQQTIQPEGEPGSELLVHHARGELHLARGQFEQAREAFGVALRMQQLLAGSHAFGIATRARLIQTQARMGDLADARAGLDALTDEDRDDPTIRMAAATVALATGDGEAAVASLAPVIAGALATPNDTVVQAALVIDALARGAIGDARGAEASLEKALEIAERDGVLFNFAAEPARDMLERHDRHRTAHPTVLASILDMLRGDEPVPVAGAVAPLREELSEAELRVVRYLPSNLKAPEIASELFVSPNTVRTHLRHIYAKLDAHSRTEAVARARELRLLGPSAHLR